MTETEQKIAILLFTVILALFLVVETEPKRAIILLTIILASFSVVLY